MKNYSCPLIEVLLLSSLDDIIRTSGLNAQASGEGGRISMEDLDVI